MHDNYTPQQITIIVDAIKQGRRALMLTDERPRTFANAYIRAGGLNLPGEALDSEIRRRMEIHIMTAVNGRQAKIEEPPAIRNAIHREVARIFGEVERFQMMKYPNLVGYRLDADEKVADQALCKRYTEF
ncbi:MAG: hypothetical protein GY703_02685, partial [Gammaproteobacteria bacterium]|nr:hypothetical protein [Gammaproteobacteria bacterium]